jgi:alkylhydroperoxidase/carboxymuconolactone decarboxylase family protein YurZ
MTHDKSKTLDRMKRREFMKAGAALLAVALWRGEPAFAEEKSMSDPTKPNASARSLTYEDVRAVSPAPEHYTKGSLLDGVWKRTGLSNEEAEKQRATQVGNNFGAVSPGLVANTTDLLFRDLWLRPALAPRDRSLITVSALIANGQTAQITYHLNRAMDNGLTQEQAYEVLT